MSPKHHPYRLPPDAEEFTSVLRDRMTLARRMRGLTLDEAARRMGSRFPEKMEVGKRQHVYLDQLVALARGYDVSLRWLLEGGEPGPCAGSHDPRRVRRNLRHLRGGVGAPFVVKAAWGKPGAVATLYRWESGPYRMDLARLWQLAQLYRVTLFRLLTEDFTGESR